MDKDYQEALKPDESSVQDAVCLITDKIAELSKTIEGVQKDFVLLIKVMNSTSNKVEFLSKEEERLEKVLAELSHRLLVLEREEEKKRRRWQEFKDLTWALFFTAIFILAAYGAAVLIEVL